MKDVGKDVAGKSVVEDDDADDYIEENDDRVEMSSNNMDNIRNKLTKKSNAKKSKPGSKTMDSDDDEMTFERPSAKDEKRAEILREIRALKKDLKSEKVEKEDPKTGKKRTKSETEEAEAENDLLKSLKEEKVWMDYYIFLTSYCRTLWSFSWR